MSFYWQKSGRFPAIDTFVRPAGQQKVAGLKEVQIPHALQAHAIEIGFFNSTVL